MNQQQAQKEKKIGFYVLGKTIGEGTFGKVKLATHTLTKEKVAIKILVKQKIIDVADVQRVSRQIHILKLIRHPSIIQLYEIIETSRHLFLVMEYVQKGQLFDYIVNKTKLQEIQACRFFKNIISGISYLHELNIVHRDLKPENLLVDWKCGLKIVDFGLSNTYKSGQLLKTACGSPCYAAPEMISNKKYNGLEVDIWSSGVILFAMVCGYLPFEDNNTSQLYKKILSGQYVLPKSISQQFKDLLSKILCVDPQKRYKIKDIYNHDWCRQINDIPLNSGIIVGYHRIPVDKTILQKLKQFELDMDYAQRCIEANKHNHITTTYYLLLKKHLKEGYNSKADLGSPSFDYSSVEPFKRVTQKKLNQSSIFSQNTLLNIQNNDIRLSKKSQSQEKNSKMRSQYSKFQQKRKVNPDNTRSNNFFNKDKKILSQVTQQGRLSNDLRMYLKPSSKKKVFYSQMKKRKDLRLHGHSLHHESIDNKNYQSENHAARLNTEYQTQQKTGFRPNKYYKMKAHYRFLNKPNQQKN